MKKNGSACRALTSKALIHVAKSLINLIISLMPVCYSVYIFLSFARLPKKRDLACKYRLKKGGAFTKLKSVNFFIEERGCCIIPLPKKTKFGGKKKTTRVHMHRNQTPGKELFILQPAI